MPRHATPSVCSAVERVHPRAIMMDPSLSRLSRAVTDGSSGTDVSAGEGLPPEVADASQRVSRALHANVLLEERGVAAKRERRGDQARIPQSARVERIVYVPEDLPQPCVVHEHHCGTGTRRTRCRLF